MYRDVTVDEELLNEWDESFIPKELINSMTVIDDVEGESEERQRYVSVMDKPLGGSLDESIDHEAGSDGESQIYDSDDDNEIHDRRGSEIEEIGYTQDRSVVSNVDRASGVVGAELTHLIGSIGKSEMRRRKSISNTYIPTSL